MSRITMLPQQESGNIYTILLYRALESAGIRYEAFPYSLRWVLDHAPRERFHYVHFHWPEVFFALRPRAWRRLWGLKGYFLLHGIWLALKLRGYRIVWTVHEVEVHDTEQLRWMHAASRHLLWQLCDVVFFHTDDVRREAGRRWGQKRFAYTIPHGSYEGAYPDDIGRDAARRRLGIPAHAVTFVFFGNVRPYKGVDVLLDGFRAIVESHPAAHLLVAGKPHSAALQSALTAQAASIANVHLHLDFVPDDEVQVYLRASDCFVAPYRHIETSGVVYLAIAFELPIIITAEGNVRDFTRQSIGIFLDDASQVGDAMRRFLALSPTERDAMRAATRAASREYSWDSLRHRYREAFDTFESAHAGAGAGES